MRAWLPRRDSDLTPWLNCPLMIDFCRWHINVVMERHTLTVVDGLFSFFFERKSSRCRDVCIEIEQLNFLPERPSSLFQFRTQSMNEYDCEYP